MNKEDVLTFLTTILSAIMTHDVLIPELSNMIGRSGFERKFFNALMARLKYLENFGTAAIKHREWFESLTHQAEGLYSMRLKDPIFNIRILYSFLPDGRPVLLVAFKERSGKRVSSYEAYTPIAKERLTNIGEAYEHEK